LNPATLITQAEEDGVHLALSDTGTLKASGYKARIAKWLPIIRERKVGIVAVLAFAANDPTPDPVPRYGGLVHFTDRDPVYATYSPEATHAEVLRGYPDAVAAEPADSAPSIEPAAPKEPVTIDDRITCRQCQNITYAGVCLIARLGGMEVSAQKGYRPAGADTMQRCNGFESKPLKGAPAKAASPSLPATSALPPRTKKRYS
jgi:hypothetical protein